MSTEPTRYRNPDTLLQELGIANPQEIEIETVAQHCGATIVYELLEGCAGRIIGNRDRAIITVNRSARLEQQRFTAAHELGHWIWHRGKVALICDHDQLTREWTGNNKEVAANRYAAELLMPAYLFQPMAAGKPITFDTVRSLAKLFQTSLTATAVRLVELATNPCMAVYSTRDRRTQFIPSAGMKAAEQWPRRTLRPETGAHGLLHRDDEPCGPVTLPASVWFGGKEAKMAQVTEDSILVTTHLVLTLLSWQALSPSASQPSSV